MFGQRGATYIVCFLLAATATALSCAPGDVLEYVVTNTATHEGPAAPLVSATHRVTLTCGPRREQWHDVDVRVEAHQSPHGFSKDRHHAALGLGAVVSTSTPLNTHSRSDAWTPEPQSNGATFHAGIMFNGSVAYVEARHESEHSSHTTLSQRDLVLKLLQLLQPEDGADTHALPASGGAPADASAARDFFAPGSVGEPTVHAEVESPTAAATAASAADSVVVLHRLASHRPASGPKPTGTTGTTHSHAVRRDATVARVHKSAKLRFHHAPPEDHSMKPDTQNAASVPFLSQETDAVLVRHTRALAPMVAVSGTGHSQLRIVYPRAVALHGDSSFGLLLDDVVLSLPRMSEADSSAAAIHVSVSCGEFSAENTAPLTQWQAAFTATLLKTTRRATIPSACNSITLTANLMSSDEAVRAQIVIEQPKSVKQNVQGVQRKAWAASYEAQFQCTPETGRGFPEGTTPRRAFDLLVAEFRGASSLTDDSAFVDAHGVPTSISLRIASFLDCFPEYAAEFSANFLLRARGNDDGEKKSLRAQEVCGWTASVLASMHHPTAAQAAFAKCLDGPCCLQLNDAVAIIARLPAITDLKLVDRVAALASRSDVDANAVAMVLRQWKADKWTKAARFGRLFPKLFGEGGDLDPNRRSEPKRTSDVSADDTTQRSMHEESVPAAPYSQFRYSALMSWPHSSSFQSRARYADSLGTSNYGIGGIVRNNAKATVLFGAVGAYEYDLDIQSSAAYIRLYMLGSSCDLAGGTVRYRWHQYRDVSPGDPTGSGPYCPSREYAPNVTAPLKEGQNQNYDMREEWGLFKPWMIAVRGPETVSEVPASDGLIQERTDTSCAAAFDLETARTQHPETFSHDTFDGLPNGALPPPVLWCLARARYYYGHCDGDRGQYALQLMNCLEIRMNQIVAPILHLDRGQELLDSLAGFFGVTMRWRIASGRNSSEPCKEYLDCLKNRRFCGRFGDACFWNQVRLKKSNIWNGEIARKFMASPGNFACPKDSFSCKWAGYCPLSPKQCIENLWDVMVKPYMPKVESGACASLTAQKLLAIGAAQFVMTHLREMGFMLVYEHRVVGEERCRCVKRTLSTYLAQDDGYTSHYSASSSLKSQSVRGGAKPTDVKQVYGTTCTSFETNVGISIDLVKIPVGFSFYVTRRLSIHLSKSGASATRVPGDAPAVSTAITSEFDVSGAYSSTVKLQGTKTPGSVSISLHSDAKPIRGTASVTTHISIDGNQRVKGTSEFYPNVRLKGYRKYVSISGCIFGFCVSSAVHTIASSHPKSGRPYSLWHERKNRPGLSIDGYGYMMTPIWTPRVRSGGFVGGQPFVLCNAEQRQGCPSTFAYLDYHRGDRDVRTQKQTSSRNIAWLTPKAAPGTTIKCEHIVRSCESLQGRRYTNTAVYDPLPPNITITRGRNFTIDDPNVTANPGQRCFTFIITARGPAPVRDVLVSYRVPGFSSEFGFQAVSVASATTGMTHCFAVTLPATYIYIVATTASGAIARVASKAIIVDITPLALRQYTIGCAGDAVTLPPGGQANFIWVKTNPVCVSFNVTVPESGISSSVVFLEDSAGVRSTSSILPISNAGIASGSIDVAENGRYRFVFVVTKRKDGTSMELPTALFGLDSTGPANTKVWFVNKTSNVRTLAIGPVEDVCLAWPQGGFYDASGVVSISATVTCASGATASASLPPSDIGTATQLCVGVMPGVVGGERCTGNVTAVDTPGFATSSTIIAVNDNTPPVIDAFLVNCGTDARAYNATIGRPIQIPSSRMICLSITAHDPDADVDSFAVRILSDSGALLVSSTGSFNGKNSTNTSLMYAFARDANYTATLTTRNVVNKQSPPVSVLFSVNPAAPKLPDEEMPTIVWASWKYEISWPSFACNPCPTEQKVECIIHDYSREIHRKVYTAMRPTKGAWGVGVYNISCVFSRIEPTGELAYRQMPPYAGTTTISADTQYAYFSGNTIMNSVADIGLSPAQDSFTCWWVSDQVSEYGKNFTLRYDNDIRMHSRWFFTKRLPGTDAANNYRFSPLLRCHNDKTHDVVSIGGGSDPYELPAGGWSLDESDRITDFVSNGGDPLTHYTINLTWTVNNISALADDKINTAEVTLNRISGGRKGDLVLATTFTPAQLRSGAAQIVVTPSQVFEGNTEYRVLVNYTTKAADPAGAGKRILHASQFFSFIKPSSTAWTGVYFSVCDRRFPWDQTPPREHLRARIGTGDYGILQIVDRDTGRNITGRMTRLFLGSFELMELPLGPWSRYNLTVWRPTPNRNVTMTASRPLLENARLSFQTMLVAFDGLRELTHSFSRPYIKAGETIRIALTAPMTVARGGDSKVTIHFSCEDGSAEALLRRHDATVNATHTYWDVDLLQSFEALRHLVGNSTTGLATCTVKVNVQPETPWKSGLCSEGDYTDNIDSTPALITLLDSDAVAKNTSLSGCESAVVSATEACMTIDVTTPLQDVAVTAEFGSASKTVALATLLTNNGRICLDITGQNTAQYHFSATAKTPTISTKAWSCASVKITDIDTAMFVAPFGGSPTNPALPKSASAVTSAAATAQMQSDQNVWSGTSEVCLALPKGMLLQPLEVELLATAQVHIRTKGDTAAVPPLPTDAASMPLVGSLTGGGLTGTPPRLPFRSTAVQHFCVPLGDVLSLLTNGSSIYVDVGLQLPATKLKAVARVRATYVTPKGAVGPDSRAIGAAVVGGTVGPAPHDGSSVAVAIDVDDGASVVVCFAHRFPQRHGVSVQVRVSNTSSWMSVPQVVGASRGANPNLAMDAEPWVRYKVPQISATDAGCTTIVANNASTLPTIEQRTIENGAISTPIVMTLFLDNSRAFSLSLPARTIFLFSPDSRVELRCETFRTDKTATATRNSVAPPHSVVGILRLVTRDHRVIPLQRVSGLSATHSLSTTSWIATTEVCFNVSAAQTALNANRSMIGDAAGVVLSVFALSTSGAHAALPTRPVIYALPNLGGARAVVPTTDRTQFAIDLSLRVPADITAMDDDVLVTSNTVLTTAAVQDEHASVLGRGMSAEAAEDAEMMMAPHQIVSSSSAAVVDNEALFPQQRQVESTPSTGRGMTTLGLKPASDAGSPAIHYVTTASQLRPSVTLDWRFGISNFTFCVSSVTNAGVVECDLSPYRTSSVGPTTTAVALYLSTIPTASLNALVKNTEYVLQYGYNLDGGYRVVVNTIVFVLADTTDKPPVPRLSSFSAAVWSSSAPSCPEATPQSNPIATLKASSSVRNLQFCFEESAIAETQVPIESYRVSLKRTPSEAFNAGLGYTTPKANATADLQTFITGRLYIRESPATMPHGTTLFLCIEAVNYAAIVGSQICRTVLIVATLPPAPSPLDGVDGCVDRTLTAQKSIIGVNWCGADVSRNWTEFGVYQFSAQCTVTRASDSTTYVTSNLTVDVQAQVSVWTASLSDGDKVNCTVCSMSPLGGICATTNGVTIAATGDASEVLYASYDPPTPPTSVAICTDTSVGAARCHRSIAHNAASINMTWTACNAPSNMSIAVYHVCVLGSVSNADESPPSSPLWCGTFSNATRNATITDTAALTALSENRTLFYASVKCNTSAGVAVETLTQAPIVSTAPPTPTLPTAALAAAAGSTCVAVNASSEATIDGGQCSMCGATPAAQIATHLRFTTAPSSIIALVEGRSGAPATAAQLKAAFLTLQNTTSISALDAWLEGPPILNVFVPHRSRISYKDTTVAPTIVTDAVALCCADVSAAPCSVTAGGSDAAATIQASVSSAGLSSATVSQSVRVAGSDAVGPARDSAASTTTSVHGLKVTDTALTVCAPAHAPRTAANAAGDGVVYHVWARGEGDDALNVELALPAISITVSASATRTSTSGCVSWPMNANAQTLIDGKNITFHARVVDLATGGRLESATAVGSLRVLVSATAPQIGLVTATVVSRATSNVQCSAAVTAITQPHSVSFMYDTVSAAAVAAPSRTVVLGYGYHRFEYDALITGSDIATLVQARGQSSVDVNCTFKLQQYASSTPSEMLTETSEPAPWSVPTTSLTFALRQSTNATASMPAWVWANKSFHADVTAFVGSVATAVESSVVDVVVSSTEPIVTVEAQPCADQSLAAVAPSYGAVAVTASTPGRCTLAITPQIAAASASSTIPQDGKAPVFVFAWTVADAATRVTFPGASQSHTVAVWDVANVTLAFDGAEPTAVGQSGSVTATLRSSTGAVVSVDSVTELTVSCAAGCSITGNATKTAVMGKATFAFTVTSSSFDNGISVVGRRSETATMPSVDVSGTLKIGDSLSSLNLGSSTSASGGIGSSSGNDVPGSSNEPEPSMSSMSPDSSGGPGTTPNPTSPTSGSSGAPGPSTPTPTTPAPTTFVDDQPPMLVITRTSAATEVSAIAGHVHHLPVRVQYRNHTALVVPDVTAMSMVSTVAGQQTDTCIDATIVRYAPQDPTASTTAQSTAMDTRDTALLSIRFTAGSTPGTCGFRLSGPIPANSSWYGDASVSIAPRTVRCAFTHKLHIPGQPAAVKCVEEVPSSSSSVSGHSHRSMFAAAAVSTQKIRSVHCPIIGRCSGVACGTPLTATTAAGTACGLHSIAEVNTNAASGSGTTGDVQIFSAHLPGLRLDNYSSSSTSSASLRLTVNATAAVGNTVSVTMKSAGGVFDRQAFIESTAKKLGVTPAQIVISSLALVPGSTGQYTVGVVVLREDEQTPVTTPEASASLSNGCVQVVGAALPSHCTAKAEDDDNSKALAIGLGIGIPLLLLAIAACVGGAVWWFVIRDRSDDDDESDVDAGDLAGQGPSRRDKKKAAEQQRAAQQNRDRLNQSPLQAPASSASPNDIQFSPPADFGIPSAIQIHQPATTGVVVPDPENEQRAPQGEADDDDHYVPQKTAAPLPVQTAASPPPAAASAPAAADPGPEIHPYQATTGNNQPANVGYAPQYHPRQASPRQAQDDDQNQNDPNENKPAWHEESEPQKPQSMDVVPTESVSITAAAPGAGADSAASAGSGGYAPTMVSMSPPRAVAAANGGGVANADLPDVVPVAAAAAAEPEPEPQQQEEQAAQPERETAPAEEAADDPANQVRKLSMQGDDVPQNLPRRSDREEAHAVVEEAAVEEHDATNIPGMAKEDQPPESQEGAWASGDMSPIEGSPAAPGPASM